MINHKITTSINVNFNYNKWFSKIYLIKSEFYKYKLLIYQLILVTINI